MLNTQRALAKIRSGLEGRKGRKCCGCKQFGHLAKDCRNKGGRVEERKKKTTNRFKALASRVMQCGIKEVRRQKKVEEEIRCFRYGEQGHKKWECPRKNERKRGEVVCHKSPARTKNSTVGGMGRTRTILRWTRRRVLKLKGDKKVTRLGHVTSHMMESSGRFGSYLSVHIDK